MGLWLLQLMVCLSWAQVDDKGNLLYIFPDLQRTGGQSQVQHLWVACPHTHRPVSMATCPVWNSTHTGPIIESRAAEL